MEKDQGRPQAQPGSGPAEFDSLKTVLEPKTGPFEPFEIIELSPYL